MWVGWKSNIQHLPKTKNNDKQKLIAIWKVSCKCKSDAFYVCRRIDLFPFGGYISEKILVRMLPDGEIYIIITVIEVKDT